MECPTCNTVFKSYTAVSLHFRSRHGTSAQLKEVMRQRLLTEKHGGVEPKCKCGCGVTPKYYDHKRGYAEFIRGHVARVKNNWGHNKDAQKKSQDKRREQIANGTWVAWNKGSTKDTDPRVAAYGRAQSENFTPKRRKQRSERMTKNRLSKVVRDLRGPDHGMWKGGVSALQPIVRSYVFNSWSRPIMERDRFTCQKCGQQHHLCVHHNGERFAGILQKAMIHLQCNDATALTFEEKVDIAKWVVQYHSEKSVTGITLCEGCHTQEHAA